MSALTKIHVAIGKDRAAGRGPFAAGADAHRDGQLIVANPHDAADAAYDRADWARGWLWAAAATCRD